MDLDFNQYLKAFQRYWWFIPATMLLSIGLGFAYSMSQTSLYEAQISLVISPKGIDDPRDLVDSLGTLARSSGVSVTSCRILDSPAVQDQAAQSLGIPAEIADEYDTGCVVLPDSTVLRLQVQGKSPELAADYANAIGMHGAIYINELYDVLKLGVLAPATVDSTPISPDHATNIMLSVIIGLMGGVGFIVLRETLMQLWGKSAVADMPVAIDSTIAALTLSPTVAMLREMNAQSLSTTQIEELFAQQIRLFIERSGEKPFTTLYSGEWQYLIIMPAIDKKEAKAWVTTFMDTLRTETFSVPDVTILAQFTAVASVSENENSLIQWNALLRQNIKAAQQDNAPNTWRIDVN